jgi:hypothetical protein
VLVIRLLIHYVCNVRDAGEITQSV